MIGAYYSKPDWHSKYFWWPKYATPDRNVNYDIRKYNWRWNQFKNFAYNQIKEITTDYGGIDILWLDGGWVRPLETVNDEVRAWGAAIPEWSQDIDIPRIAQMARENQPGLLIVDRTVHGAYENYQTPEQSIPKQQIKNPWESCITLGNAWGHVANDEYKSAAKVIHLLAEVVSKGGNLLLGVGPSPEGTLSAKQISRLNEIGAWLQANGAAIYGTRTVDHFQSGRIFFTQTKSGQLNAIYCQPEGEQVSATITWSGNLPRKGSTVRLLQSNEKVKWKVSDRTVVVQVPTSMQRKFTPALVFTYQSE
jgi:alpha-L-fucosidase